MQEIRLIGVSGKAGSGKDEVTKILCRAYLEKYLFEDRFFFENKKFAAKLKHRLELTFPSWFNVNKWETLGAEYRDSFIPSLGLTRRELLIAEGTKAREIHPDYWVQALFSDYYDKQMWVISDTRFLNEVREIKRRGGIIIRVERPSLVSTSTDPTETELDDYDFDFYITNDGSISDLEIKVRKFMEYFKI